jgi:hypothetical protein
MWIFGNKKNQKTVRKNRQPEPKQERLEDGELPWGWISRNKAFTGKIEREYTYFMNKWIDSRKKTQKEEYAALKSFVLYLEKVEKLCKIKGECFEFWFNEILTGKGYLEKRKKELETLKRD